MNRQGIGDYRSGAFNESRIPKTQDEFHMFLQCASVILCAWMTLLLFLETYLKYTMMTLEHNCIVEYQHQCNETIAWAKLAMMIISWWLSWDTIGSQKVTMLIAWHNEAWSLFTQHGILIAHYIIDPAVILQADSHLWYQMNHRTSVVHCEKSDDVVAQIRSCALLCWGSTKIEKMMIWLKHKTMLKLPHALSSWCC